MGVTTSLSKNGRRYAADKKYTYMPNELHRPVSNLVASFKAMPPLKGKYYNMPVSDTLTWIVDCQFIPYNDSAVVTSVAAYFPRPGRTPVIANRSVNGLLCVWNFGQRLKCEMIKGTSTNAAVPRVHPHPNGEYICYIGAGNITLMDVHTLERSVKNKDSQFATFKYLTISPNGSYVAYISRAAIDFSITVMMKEGAFFTPIYENRLNNLCLSFVGTRQYTEHVECKWSPDSAYIAIGSTMGHLIIVKREGLDSFCGIVPGMFELNGKAEQEPTVLASPMAFDFDPRYKHSVLVFVDTRNKLYMCNTEKREVVIETVVETMGSVNCIHYDFDGRLLAVATSEGILEIRCPDTLDILYAINMSTSTPGNPGEQLLPMPTGGAAGPMVQLNGQYPAVTRLSFSQFGDYVAVSSADGYARVWQLRPDISLQNLCRKTILHIVKANDIWRLPLPPRILMYLLQWSREIWNDQVEEVIASDRILRAFRGMVL